MPPLQASLPRPGDYKYRSRQGDIEVGKGGMKMSDTSSENKQKCQNSALCLLTPCLLEFQEATTLLYHCSVYVCTCTWGGREPGSVPLFTREYARRKSSRPLQYNGHYEVTPPFLLLSRKNILLICPVVITS